MILYISYLSFFLVGEWGGYKHLLTENHPETSNKEKSSKHKKGTQKSHLSGHVMEKTGKENENIFWFFKGTVSAIFFMHLSLATSTRT